MISEMPFQCHITGASEIIIILDLDSCACQQSIYLGNSQKNLQIEKRNNRNC